MAGQHLLLTLVCYIIAGNVAAGSPWTTHSRELVRKEDRKSAPSGGETSATILPNYFRPKFSRYTPFMTEDSLPAPVFGRALKRYRGSRPRESKEADDESRRPTATRHNSRGPRDSGESRESRPRTRPSNGIGGRSRARDSNERPKSKSSARVRNRPQKSRENARDDSRPKYEPGVRGRTESKNSNEGPINRGPPKNRSSIRSPPSLTRPRKISAETSGERNVRRQSSHSTEADSREAAAARHDRNRQPVGRGKEGNRPDHSPSNELNSADRKTTSDDREHRSGGPSEPDRNIGASSSSVNRKSTHNSRESIVKGSPVASGESKFTSKLQRDSREEDPGRVKSKTLLFNGSGPLNDNKTGSEPSTNTDRTTSVASTAVEAENVRQTTPEAVTTVRRTFSSEVDEKDGKFRAGRLFSHRQRPSDERIGRDRAESRNSSESVGYRQPSTPTTPPAGPRESSPMQQQEEKSSTPSIIAENTITARSKSSEADRSDESPKIRTSNREDPRARNSAVKSGERTRPEAEKPVPRRPPPPRSVGSSSVSRSAESQKGPPRRSNRRDSAENIPENRKFSSEDSSERRPRLPPPSPPRRPPAGPPRLPPPPAPSQFFGDFAVPTAGQMFPQFGAPLGGFPSAFPFPGLNVPPSRRGPQALI